MLPSTHDVVVIGGGIVGAAVAERLSRDGLSVTLVERGVVGREASYAAAGLLTPVHPWKYPPALLALDDESLAMWPDLAQRLREETGADVELRRTGLLFVLESDEDEREADRRVAWKRERGERVERLSTAELLEASRRCTPRPAARSSSPTSPRCATTASRPRCASPPRAAAPRSSSRRPCTGSCGRATA